jgi:peptidoglycan/xylan/chitin deacetylase (PgdA/CDA1 family)
MSKLPAYYTRLAPFVEYFATGVPILMYHKVGRRPWNVRLKGLYSSRKLLEQQLKELCDAGYRTCSLDAARQSPPHCGGVVVLTFDDGFANVLQHALEPLGRNSFRAIQFLVTDRLGAYNEWEVALGEVPEPLMDVHQVRDWLAAGHEIGSHSCIHPYLTQIPLPQAREEISASKKKLEDLFGRPIRHFCYPYGDYNVAVSNLVQEAGYATACTTRGGINTAATDPFELLRLTSRYRSRSLRSIKSWLKARFTP